jgi:putative ABC transport system ATP-binding protein
MTGRPLVEVREVRKAYRRGAEEVHALRGVSLALYPGELVALMGPSGSGKSTLLNLVCGWEAPDQGELAWPAGEPGSAPPWAQVAVVPQALGLVEELSLRENVALPVRLGAVGGAARARTGRTDELLELFGLGSLAERPPSQTSLGEQQRAAVARALVLSPRLVLADEPSAHLDQDWGRDVLSALRGAAAQGAACLVATHDPEALAFADRAVVLDDGRLTEMTLS